MSICFIVYIVVLCTTIVDKKMRSKGVANFGNFLTIFSIIVFIIENSVIRFADIYNELIAKKNRGVNIRVLVSNEPTNNTTVQKLEREGVDVKVVNTWGENGRNRMHHKFCIVDLDYVMHGSYNWSKNANYNEETLATALDREFVSKFADEFMEIYNEIV